LAEFLRRARKERKEMLDKDLQLDLIKAVAPNIK
jgi:DNA repair exonuclease SbcCD ATPase subunit